MNISVRPFLDDDLMPLEQLFLRSRIAAFHWTDPEQIQLSDFLTQTEGEVIYVAVDETDKALGFISVWEPDRFIHHLFVDPEYKRRGIGTALLNSLDSWLPKPYRLKCLIANSEAHAFYLNKGWREAGRGEDASGEYAEMVCP